MTEGEVLARARTARHDHRRQDGGTARWTYLPAAGDPETVTTLTFDKGAVVDVERKVVKK